SLLEWLQSVDAFDERRLAGARGTADHDDFALLDMRRAILQHLKIGVPLADLAECDHGTSSANDRNSPLQPAHEQRGRERDYEINQRGEQIHLHQTSVALRYLRRRAEKIGDREHVDQ